jgi:5-methylcytosine-specific restriction protein A
MLPDPDLIARSVSAETGLPFTGRRLTGPETTIELSPTGHSTSQTFVLSTKVGWRSLGITFKPGAYAADIVGEMGKADETGRSVFAAILSASVEMGAVVDLTVNSRTATWSDETLWTEPWTSLHLELRKGQLPLQSEVLGEDRSLIEAWTGRVAAAIVSLLPLEVANPVEPDVVGLPEGALVTIQANRYERDRRNRAAALAIHGFACQACDIVLSHVYGEAANGFIEVHHLTPVSTLGPGYVIDPKTDLAPLCPNCHGMAHRRTPPFSIGELRGLLGRN